MFYNPNSSDDAYLVNTPIYEGPLGLLLQLIEKAELDITKLALAQVTDQYLDYLRQLKDRNLENISEFIVIGSRLIQIKSEALLPRPVIREPGEEDPGEALAMQLIAYKRFRQIADLLAQKDAAGLRSHLRLAPTPQFDPKLDLTGIGLPELISAAQAVLAQTGQLSALSTVVTRPRITIREKIRRIAQILRYGRLTAFTALITDRSSRLDIVVTFLAVLELIKRQLVEAQQDKMFGEIAIKPAESLVFDENIEIEFGE
jgi:segregation and condensation protein A